MHAHCYGWPEPYMHSAHTVFLAGKSPNMQSYTVHTYGSGQPCTLAIRLLQPNAVAARQPQTHTSLTHTHTHPRTPTPKPTHSNSKTAAVLLLLLCVCVCVCECVCECACVLLLQLL